MGKLQALDKVSSLKSFPQKSEKERESDIVEVSDLNEVQKLIVVKTVA